MRLDSSRRVRIENARESQVLQVGTVPDEMVARLRNPQFTDAREYSVFAPERFRNGGSGAGTQDLQRL